MIQFVHLNQQHTVPSAKKIFVRFYNIYISFFLHIVRHYCLSFKWAEYGASGLDETKLSEMFSDEPEFLGGLLCHFFY